IRRLAAATLTALKSPSKPVRAVGGAWSNQHTAIWSAMIRAHTLAWARLIRLIESRYSGPTERRKFFPAGLAINFWCCAKAAETNLESSGTKNSHEFGGVDSHWAACRRGCSGVLL